MRVLVLNAGSTSVKVTLFEGSSRRRFSVSTEGGPGALVQRLGTQGVDWSALDAVGHRVVHGGERHQRPTRLTPEVLAELRELAPYDPTHLPQEIALVEAILALRPELPQVACFDTAFHATLPPVARVLPLPWRLHERGVRRYGFHGLSYQWSLREIARQAGPEAARGRLVLAHLGGGASLAAVRDGSCIDTSMGFSPNAGVPMATRSGDVDPGVMAYLARTEGLDVEGFAALASEQSGLLGVSGSSGDMRTLVARAPSDPRAELAVALFAYEVKKRIGAFAAALGGLERLVFTGGIGEHSAEVRARVCDGLGFLGVALDPARNAEGGAVISPADSRVTVHVIPADEERMILEGVQALLNFPRAPKET
jgi:acetate kinase